MYLSGRRSLTQIEEDGDNADSVGRTTIQERRKSSRDKHRVGVLDIYIYI